MTEPKTDDEAKEELLRQHARLLQEELGIPGDFLETLVDEPDDWSFVIKLTALVEGALTHVLSQALDRPELRDVFAHLDLGHTKAGKIVFARTLGVLDSSGRTFITKLLEMRNVFAHDVRSVSMTIPEYLASLPPDKLKGVVKGFSYFAVTDSVKIGNRSGVPATQFVVEQPRLAVWFSAMNLIAISYFQKSLIVENRDLERQIKERMERFIDSLYSPPVPASLGPTLASMLGQPAPKDGNNQ